MKTLQFNNSLSSSTFPNALKYANATPVLKIDDKINNGNYRQISILPTVSKIYERLKLSNILDKTKCIRNLINFFQNSSVVFKKVLILSTASSQ